MEVRNTSPTAQANPSESASAKASLDYSSFLKLLVAQMRNQDPTSPMDPTAQMAQLATFSQVEQSIKTNSKLDAILTSAALSQADGIIGRTVTSPDGTVSGEAVSLKVVTGGAVAVLQDGREVPLGPGVSIS